MKVGFTGHQNLPDSASALLVRELDEMLAATHELVGMCSLAEGGDQVFAEAVLRARGNLHVVVPCEGYEQTFGTDGLARYLELVSRAQNVQTLAFPSPSEEAYMAAGRRVVSESHVLYACWDGEESGGLGGTADVVAYARRKGVPVVIIWPAGVKRQ